MPTFLFAALVGKCSILSATLVLICKFYLLHEGVKTLLLLVYSIQHAHHVLLTIEFGAQWPFSLEIPVPSNFLTVCM